MSSKDVVEIREILDNLLVQTSIITIRLNALNSMVLGVWGETMPEEQFRNIYTTFVDLLEQNTKEAFVGIEGALFDSGAFLLRQKMQGNLDIQSMKANTAYIDRSKK